ncbi:YggT family protein [Candidatus Parcubacteria bacterium]|nr:MAG: YggT family protein [Candidatus Parcubacteria bacterium]
MDQVDTTKEEVTTTRQVEPLAKGEAPQKVYEKKKTILRFNQIIWYILGLVEVLLVFRVILKVLGANPFVGFTSLIYSITTPLSAPFAGILGVSAITGNSIIEWSTIIAVIVYLCVAWGFVYLVDLIYPITPRDVETE